MWFPPSEMASACPTAKFIHRSGLYSVKAEVFFVCLFCLFAFSKAAPAAYGGFQARDLIGAVAAGPMPEPQQCRIRAASVTSPQPTAMWDP